MSRRSKLTDEERITAVQEYLEGKGSQVEICSKYHITSDGLLIQWIKYYNT